MELASGLGAETNQPIIHRVTWGCALPLRAQTLLYASPVQLH